MRVSPSSEPGFLLMRQCTRQQPGSHVNDRNDSFISHACGAYYGDSTNYLSVLTLKKPGIAQKHGSGRRGSEASKETCRFQEKGIT